MKTFIYTLWQKITLKVHHGACGKMLIIHPRSLWENFWREQIPFRSFSLNIQQSDVQLKVYYFCRMHTHSEFAVLRNGDKTLICALGFGKRLLCVSDTGPGVARAGNLPDCAAGGCLQHVQPGTRNVLMINHCQPLFSSKTWLSDTAHNEALFLGLLLCDCASAEAEPRTLQDAAPTLPKFEELGWEQCWTSAC